MPQELRPRAATIHACVLRTGAAAVVMPTHARTLAPSWQVTADMLKRQEREAGRSRQWRGSFKALQRQLLQLEEDEALLDSVFPPARRAGGRLRLVAGEAWRGAAHSLRSSTCSLAS